MPYARCDSLSPSGLRDSHILHSLCKEITFGSFCKPAPTKPHGLRTWRFVVAVPAAEACSDPGEPSKRAYLVRIFLTRSLGFKGGADGFGGRDEILVGNVGR